MPPILMLNKENWPKWLLAEMALAEMTTGRNGIGQNGIGRNGFWPKWHWPKWVLAKMALAEMGFGLNGIGLNGYWPNWELDQVALDKMALDKMGLDEVAIPRLDTDDWCYSTKHGGYRNAEYEDNHRGEHDNERSIDHGGYIIRLAKRRSPLVSEAVQQAW